MTRRGHQSLLAAVVSAAALSCLPAVAHAGNYSVLFADGQGCGLFTPSATPEYQVSCGQQMTIRSGGIYGLPASGTEENFTAHAPAGISIVGASASFATPGAGANGWGSGDFYSGGGSAWNGLTSSNEAFSSGSSYWGFQLLCNNGGANCGLGGSPPQAEPAEVSVGSVTLTASEAQAPSISPAPRSLFGQGGWVWNPAGDPWPVGASASDPSGTCAITASVAGQGVSVEQQTPNQYAWQQCANGTWTTGVDTRRYVAGSGPLGISLRATDAAGNPATIANTVSVDNKPVSILLGTPNDANPTIWVNHAVQVTASASAGPSGVSGINCAVDGGHSSAYPSGGLTVDGDGVHTVACTAANGAVGPQGQHNAATSSEAIQIDEAPPAISFAPVNPADPTQVLVNAPDSESGLASGQVSIQGSHATTATPIPTNVGGSTLAANIDDKGRNGDYTVIATACDAAGNCASSSEVLHFPLRFGTRSYVSFKPIVVPSKTVHERILVGYHIKTVTRRVRVDYRVKTVIRRRHGHKVRVRVKVGGHRKRVRRRVKVGGHLKRIRIVIHADRRCGHRRVRVRRHRYRTVRSCRLLKPRIVSRRRVRYGHRAKLHGLLETAQGVAIANAPVRILTRREDRGAHFRRAVSTTTNARGYWTARLPAGPSRAIKAFYPGSSGLEPTTAQARVIVPAWIRLFISPHQLPWSATIHIHGSLAGRFIPHDGVALRLLVHYPHARQWTVLQALRTNRHGAFRFGFSFGAGRGMASYPFRIATTAAETDYPYAPGRSRPVRVTFGVPTPPQAASPTLASPASRRG